MDDIHAYHSDADVVRYVPFGPRSREEAAMKVEQFSKALSLAADGDYWQLAIERAEEPGRVIGDLFFTIRSIENAAAAIGWVLHPGYTGRGYMTEAATAILDIGFGRIGLHRVWAELDPRNDASVALCLRLGMRAEAHHVEDVWFKGEWADTGIYAILAREWVAAAATPAAGSRLGTSGR